MSFNLNTQFTFLAMFVVLVINAQSAFQNNGNVQIHNGGKIGFHTNLVNNGVFNENAGFTGFYSYNGSIEVSGINKPIFNNVEVDVYNNLFLNTSMAIKNNFAFVTGKVITPRNDLSVSLDFLNYDIYSGEQDENHVDGYVASTNNNDFIFPIGDEDYLRPMKLIDELPNAKFNGAYFMEDPNNPSTFNQSFDTNKKQDILTRISKIEFWDLNGDTETKVELTWNFNSNIEELTTNTKSLRVVGWEKTSNKWVDLGGENITGNIVTGTVQSIGIIPNNYEVITIGADFTAVGGSRVTPNKNYGFSPNGDGMNDTFVVEGIELRPNNTLHIYNRWGALVYSKNGYDNTWKGFSEHNLTISRSVGLPTGTYFYILTYHKEKKTQTGYIYLLR